MKHLIVLVLFLTSVAKSATYETTIRSKIFGTLNLEKETEIKTDIVSHAQKCNEDFILGLRI